jgi:hypothetical protein
MSNMIEDTTQQSTLSEPNEDSDLLYCNICMENKNIKICCKNKHKTCKECLDKIKIYTNICPFCRTKLKQDNIPIHILDWNIQYEMECHRYRENRRNTIHKNPFHPKYKQVNKDIKLIIEQTNCTKTEAVDALKKNDNDIIYAIMDLTK